MTDINTRGKLPFTIVSSSVNTGYATQLTSSVGYNIDIVNHHKDEYGGIENSPLQGPFTAQHVGGNQHRHVKLNDGSDDSDSRPEAYIISASAGAVKVYGPDINGIHKPRSLLTRDTIAKSPVNIKNIQTSGNVAGNFEHNYQVVQSVGRRITNNLINDGFIASGSLTTQFVSSSNQVYGLPEIENNSKSIFVERFNAPGGKEVSSRGALDREGEEYAPNNSLTTRNIGVRQPYYDRLTQHSVKPFLSKLNFLDTSIVFRNVSPALSLTFGNDGLSLYTTSIDKTYQFNLTKKYDVSTAEYRGVLAVPLGYGAGIAFDNTGNFLYQASSVTGIIKLYTLSVAWDTSTAVYTSDLTGFNASISGILFADNGNKFYTISSGTKIIKCYTLTTQWVPDSADPSTTFTDTSDMQICTGIAVKNDGKNIYVTDRYNGNVYDYTLSTAHDVSTAILTEKHFLGATGAENFDLFLEPQTNQKLFILDRSNDRLDCYINFINDYVTEEKINKNSITRIEQVKGRNGETYATSSVNDNFWVQHAIPRTDLRYSWIADSVSSSQQPIEYQSYNLPYSISNSYNSNGAFTDLSFEQKGPFGDHLGISGAIDKDEMHVSTYTNTMYRDRKYFEFDATNTYVDLSNISSDISGKDFTISFWMKSDENINYDLSIATLEKSKSIVAQDGTPSGIFFKPDGASLYMIGSGSAKIYQYTLSIPWDIDSMDLNPLNIKEISISAETTGPTGLYIKPDGFSLYISGLGTGGNLLTEYSLGTAWDISTAATPIAHSFLEDSSPNDIYFKPDGTKVYIVGDTTNKIYEKTLSTAWTLTTTSSAVSASNALITQPRGVNISPDGKRLIVLDGTRKIYYFTFHENWDLNSGLSLIPEYSHQCVDNGPLGLFINEYKQKIYYTGAAQDKIFQISFDYEPIPLLQYSGSSSDNNILLELNPSSSNIILSGTNVQSDIKSSPIINDGKWHLITIVSDLSSTTQRIRFLNLNNITNTTVTKIYADGGLATEATQKYLKLDISGLFLSSRDKVNLGRSNYNLHDIMLWDSVLTEEQINEVYRISNTSYGQQPKRYLSHKLDKPIIPRPKHVYSAKINKDNLTLADEVGSRNATLINFTASANLQPQNTGIISYSTYFNGPYQGASWKSIRNAEHPVTRKLTTENTNIVSVVIPEGPKVITKIIRGIPVRITVPGNRKQGTILNVKESPVYANNKPLKHKFILKDSQNINVGFELTHTYANNLQ